MGIRVSGVCSTAVMALVLAFGVSLAHAQTSWQFDLPPQALADSLGAVATQADINILIDRSLVAGRQAGALRGRLTADEAVTRLLKGTGIKHEFLDAKTITLVAVSDAESTGDEPVARAEGREARLVMAQNEGAAGSAGEGTANSTEPFSSKSEGENASLEEIVVTGTHIRGGAPTGSPIRSFTRAEIAGSGAQTTAQFIELLPQNFAGGIAETTYQTFVPADDRSNNNFGTGSGVNLRGLGSDATLLLVNGHRLSSTGAGDFVDVSQIPMSAIERIDVLTDGASAIYGSDAVAGVVNIVLRRDFEGAETRLRYGSVTDGSFDRLGVGQTFGNTWATGNAWLSYDYSKQGNLAQKDRDFSSPPVGDLIPEKTMHNVTLNGHQQLADVDLRYDAMYSHRKTEFLGPQSTGSVAPDQRNETPSDFYSIYVGADLPSVANWQPSVGALFSANSLTGDVFTLETGDLFSHRKFRNQLSSVNGSFSGSLLTLPSGSVKTTVGVDFRREDYEFRLYLPSSPTYPSPVKTIDNERDVKAVYFESLVPILGANEGASGTLDLSLAVRHERYSDFGDTTNPKFGLTWKPVDGLRLRSTWGTSFRAPTFNQSDDSENYTILLDFPDPDFTQTSLAFYQIGSNLDLAPEKSRSWTVGVDFKPAAVEGFSGSLDYFRTRFKDRILAPSSAAFDILANENVYSPIITRNLTAAQVAAVIANPGRGGFFNFSSGAPGDAVVLINNRAQNIGSTEVAGLDLSLAQTFDTGSMLWQLTLDVTRVLHFENQLTPQATPLDVIGTVFNLPKWRTRGGVSATLRQLQMNLFVSYVPGYSNTLTIPSSDIPSWHSVDASVSYDTGEDAAGALRNLLLRLSAQNLLDREPPYVAGASSLDLLPIGFDPANANPIGRFLSIEVVKRF